MATVLVAAILTALATGLGALPFLFVRRLSPYWVSIANATAGGLMFAATHSLVAEGVLLSPARLVAGMLLGLGGILVGRTLIGKRQHAAIADLSELDARKALLFIGVMTAHSFAEGVGVGVSFGGSDGDLHHRRHRRAQHPGGTRNQSHARAPRHAGSAATRHLANVGRHPQNPAYLRSRSDRPSG